MPFQSKTIAFQPYSDDSWSISEPLVYQGDRETFVVPKGFVTDFATVPAIVVWLFPKYGKYTLAAILHDYLCAEGITLGLVSGRDTDGIFRRVMRELGVPVMRRWLMWTGVRWGALANPVRRKDWVKDAPAIVGISILAMPLVVPGAIFVGMSLLVYRPIELLIEKISNRISP